MQLCELKLTMQMSLPECVLLSPEGQDPVRDFLEHFLYPIPVFVSLGQRKQYSNALEFQFQKISK